MAHIVVSDTIPRANFAVGAGGSSGPFTITFAVFNPETDLKVYNDGVLLTYSESPADETEWSFSGTAVDGGYNGGEINLGGSVSDTTISVVRDIPIARTSDFPYPSGALDIKALNTQLDKLFAILQDNENRLARVIRQPPEDSAEIDTLPAAADRANLFFAFDADGNPTVAAGTSANLGPVSSYIDGLLSAANEAAAKAYLNLEAGTDFPGLATANTFTANQTITSTDAGQVGPTLKFYHNSASPAASDGVGYVTFNGKDGAGNETTYAKVFGEIVDTTDTSEDGRLAVQTVIAGSLSSRAYIGAGIYTPNATGGDQGADTINASAIYDDGVQVKPLVEAVAVALNGTTGTTFSSLPAGIKRVTIQLSEVSVDDTDKILIQIGDSGGLHTSGYLSAGANFGGGGSNSVARTDGFVINTASANYVVTGILTLERLGSGNTWVASGTFSDSGSPLNFTTSGRVTLDTDLDRVAILDTGGDNFDGGSIAIKYE